MARNPLADRAKVLGIPQGNLDVAKAAVTTFLRANDDREEIDEALIRAALPTPVNDRIWNEMKKDLGITG